MARRARKAAAASRRAPRLVGASPRYGAFTGAQRLYRWKGWKTSSPTLCRRVPFSLSPARRITYLSVSVRPGTPLLKPDSLSAGFFPSISHATSLVLLSLTPPSMDPLRDLKSSLWATHLAYDVENHFTSPSGAICLKLVSFSCRNLITRLHQGPKPSLLKHC